MYREFAVAGKRVQDAETITLQEQEAMINTEKAGMTTSECKKTYQEMLNAIGDSLSDFANFEDTENGEDYEDNEDNTGLGTLSNGDIPHWVIGTMCKMVQQSTESIWQKY
jgi:hypothetical protein